MNTLILTKTYSPPPICEQEIWRYAGCKTVDPALQDMVYSCLDEARDALVYRVCYRRLPMTITGDICDFGEFQLASHHLSINLHGCREVILFAATIGVAVDRLIAKYGRISPTKALLFQAIGAERIEALCDAFCRDVAEELESGLKPRFSPGYGDLPLESQREIFAQLDCSRQIGLSLTESLLMTPTKSVTAFVGIHNGEYVQPKSPCTACNKQECAFRGAI